MSPIPVAVEVGTKRVFAVALDWPGWSRAAKDEEGARGALAASGPRYEAVLRAAAIDFTAPPDVAALEVVERLEGGSSTDFGAPGTPPAVDAAPTTEADIAHLVAVLRACWDAFSRAAEAAEGATLKTGPRGGGRDLAKIRAHVAEADAAYLTTLGGKAPRDADADQVRTAFVEALAARARGDLPDVGPRGGKRWTARYAVRRSAWHALDHAWEIEDRAGD
jgi:hypothetical protein